ncbi:Rdx family-domain-containing protein [Aspergillus leporis]|uniref:Rdx family-domain-containing protein n=1 Tax=Aspergillus leporis TaxID=41062 RepID=A0A5N5X5S2_9EURO|nr:Rdx family-domain-containing protein [Aspergillus leporis]
MATPTPLEQPQQRTPPADNVVSEQVYLPRITIEFCTQCKWMLRAAYFAQELLSTFGTDLGEVALIPTTGGIFTVTMYHSQYQSQSSGAKPETQQTVLWNRKTNGGFPEVKVLKSLVRNVIDPSKDLGHTDRALRAANVSRQAGAVSSSEQQQTGDGRKKDCEDCR